MGYHRRAFTLIELLVVVTILAVLAGMMLPSLSKAKRTATRVQCVSNLRQCGVMLQMLRDESDTAEFRDGYLWPNDVMPYAGNLESAKVFRCPTTQAINPTQRIQSTSAGLQSFGTASTAATCRAALGGGKIETVFFSYAYNQWAQRTDSPTMTKWFYGGPGNIASTSDTPMLIDGNTSEVLPWAGGRTATDLYRDPSMDDYASSGENIFVARHSARRPPTAPHPNNSLEMARWRSGLLLFDGHVETPVLRDLWRFEWSKNWEARPFAAP